MTTPLQTNRAAVFAELIDSLGGPLCEEPWWAVMCLEDGWRQADPWQSEVDWRTAANDPAGWPRPVSRLAPTVLCLGLQVGDRTGTLLPDTHYLWSGAYLKQRWVARRWQRRPLAARAPRAVYAGGEHGDPLNVIGGSDGATPRELLRRVVSASGLPVDVTLGGGVRRADQATYRAILDVDGHARTWDAWAWKIRSGSILLSQSSRWRSWFTDGFEPYDHFLPVANDFGDLAEQLEVALGGPAAADLPVAAARRAREVYDPVRVRAATRAAVERSVVRY